MQLLATEAWVAAVLGRRLLLLEPGPGLINFDELALESGEAVLGLRGGLGTPANGHRDGAAWVLLTTRRMLRRDPDDPTGAWKAETFSQERGELLWESNGLYAFHWPGTGTSLSVDAGKTILFETADLLTSPDWMGPDFVCLGRNDLYLGSIGSRRPPIRVPAPEPLAAHSPLYDQVTDRVYLSGETAVYWWQRGGQKFIPFVSAGGGAVLAAPAGVVILEGDRLRIVSHEEHVLWDSRPVMPDFAPAALPWDRAGDVLLVPTAARGAGTQLLLVDLKKPGRRWHAELEGVLPCEPRLVPGGIVAARKSEAEAALDLIWIGITPGDRSRE